MLSPSSATGGTDIGYTPEEGVLFKKNEKKFNFLLLGFFFGGDGGGVDLIEAPLPEVVAGL